MRPELGEAQIAVALIGMERHVELLNWLRVTLFGVTTLEVCE